MDRGDKTFEINHLHRVNSSLASSRYSHSESRPDILIEIQQTLYRIQMICITVVFLWVPGHSDIKGNEITDNAAK